MSFHLIQWHVAAYLRRASELFSLLMLYVLLTTVLVLAQPAGQDIAFLSSGLLWLLALLSLGLALHLLYEREEQEGWLEQWRFFPVSLEMTVLHKMLVHWVLVGWPVALSAPVIRLLLGAGVVTPSLILALMCGTLAFTALGSVAAAASLRQRAKQMVTLILVFPLALPLVIFGVPASELGGLEILVMPEGWLLLAYTAFIVPLSVVASAALLRFYHH